jgi:MYXO-CTERM domain-containing protein
MMNKTTKMTAAAAVLAFAGSAFAGEAVLSFTYSDLMGSFDAATGEYSAVVGTGSSGDVTFVPGNQTAEFDSGSFASTSAGFDLNLTISGITANSATGSGTLSIADENGDTITTDVTGSFNLLLGTVFFQGFLDNALVNDNSADGSFDGTTAGSFSTAIPGQPFSGSIVQISFDAGDFFNSSFADNTTLASGLLVPTPGAVALLGFAGLTAVRRRR